MHGISLIPSFVGCKDSRDSGELKKEPIQRTTIQVHSRDYKMQDRDPVIVMIVCSVIEHSTDNNPRAQQAFDNIGPLPRRPWCSLSWREILANGVGQCVVLSSMHNALSCVSFGVIRQITDMVVAWAPTLGPVMRINGVSPAINVDLIGINYYQIVW